MLFFTDLLFLRLGLLWMVEYCVSRLGGSIGCTGTCNKDTMMISMSKCFHFTSREPERLKDKPANVMNFCIKVCWHYNYQVPKQGEPTKEAVYYWFCTICIILPYFYFYFAGNPTLIWTKRLVESENEESAVTQVKWYHIIAIIRVLKEKLGCQPQISRITRSLPKLFIQPKSQFGKLDKKIIYCVKPRFILSSLDLDWQIFRHVLRQHFISDNKTHPHSQPDVVTMWCRPRLTSQWPCINIWQRGHKTQTSIPRGQSFVTSSTVQGLRESCLSMLSCVAYINHCSSEW